MLTEDLIRYYCHINFLKMQDHIKNIRRDELVWNVIMRSKVINMNDIVFSTLMLNPIIIYDRSHNPDVKDFIYYLDTDWTFCTCIKVSQTNIYIYSTCITYYDKLGWFTTSQGLCFILWIHKWWKFVFFSVSSKWWEYDFVSLFR